jgi:hypothetical protein
MTSPNPSQVIKDAIRRTRVATEAANNAAIHLNTQILNHRTTLSSEAAIVRDTATLLQHVVQNFDRIASALLTDKGDSRTSRKTS